ncbi:BatD family protein [Pseudoalteromonas sp. MMG005]|uniref:BatD family protein n=1 Tax=Pseudoalteromonas sp. MMG005 TaxID=2822682 RepID=UPI001B39D9AE|nr:BatD family protein [Pseudoalteromonas sp. MMG005]MBQ4846152.1 protein BatD [Pseudoalteromonas sp. MMG005]
MVMRLLIPLFLIMSSYSVAAFERLSASVDKNPVLVGEYFTLTIEADGKVSGSQPDTSALAQKFVVSPMSVGSRTNIINGSMSSQTTWQMQLLARTAGTFTIPSFTVNGKSSQPISLKVIARSQDSTAQEDIFIKTTLSPETLYVQQAGLYTVKLYIGKDLLDGQLTAPVMNDAQITLMGKQSEDYEVLDGRRYMVITREYLIQPQKSGDYTLEPPMFNGQIRENYRRMAVSAVAKPLTIEVKPVPENYQGAWLPSELVNLSEEWQPSSNEVTVGTPITRTLTLTAVGITKEQLPDINMAQISGIRSYPDESDRNQLARDGRVISQLITSFALVPQIPGTYTLPEMKVPWFNTVIKRVEYATLPARTISVIADVNQIATPTVTAPVLTTPAQTQDAVSTLTAEQIAQPRNAYDWLIMLSGYIIWLLTIIVWIICKPKQVKSPVPSEDNTPIPTLKTLQNAARHKDNAAFYNALRHYASAQANNLTLDAWINQLANPDLNIEIAKLQASLYSAGEHSVDLSALFQMLNQAIKKKTAKADNHLTQLY